MNGQEVKVRFWGTLDDDNLAPIIPLFCGPIIEEVSGVQQDHISFCLVGLGDGRGKKPPTFEIVVDFTLRRPPVNSDAVLNALSQALLGRFRQHFQEKRQVQVMVKGTAPGAQSAVSWKPPESPEKDDKKR